MDMVELNEKGLEAAVPCYSEGGCSGLDERERREVVTDIIHAYLSALLAPDDGLVERLRAGPDVRELEDGSGAWEMDPDKTGATMREASTALQSKDEQIERLTQEITEAMNASPPSNFGAQIGWKRWKDRAEAAEQQVQKLTAENERLRDALAFYADPKNYKGEFVPGGRSERGTYVLEHHINLVRKDAGNIARSALETQGGGK